MGEPNPSLQRCPRDAVERITIAVGPLEHATVVFEGAVCREHRLEIQDDQEVHVLYEPLKVAGGRPEMN
jgi:hypothetical protein